MQTLNLKMNVICKVTTLVNAEFQFFRAAVQSYKNQERVAAHLELWILVDRPVNLRFMSSQSKVIQISLKVCELISFQKTLPKFRKTSHPQLLVLFTEGGQMRSIVYLLSLPAIKGSR